MCWHTFLFWHCYLTISKHLCKMVPSAFQVLLSSWQQVGWWTKLPSRHLLSNHCLPCSRGMNSRTAWCDERQDMCRSVYFPVIRTDAFVRRFLCQGPAVIVAEIRSSPGAALLAVQLLACGQTCPGACCHWMVSTRGESKWWRHWLVLSSHPWRALIIHKEASLLSYNSC